MGPSSATPHFFDIIWHARDGVQSYERVMLPANLGKIALIGSLTQTPLLPDNTVLKNRQMEQKKRKRIVPLHLIHPGYPGRYAQGGESGHLASSIFQGPMRIRLELTSNPGG